MLAIYIKLKNKIWQILFTIIFGHMFSRLGQGSFLFYPFRCDGISNIKIGNKTVIQSSSWLYCCSADSISPVLEIGNKCVFGYNNHIACVRDVKIGNFVLTANNVYISDNFHSYEDISLPIIMQPVKFKKSVEIGDGCWIGENACIIASRIGKNCVIGANAVVTHDVPDYSVVAGCPARIIKTYDTALKKWINK